MILESNAQLAEPIEFSMSGLQLTAGGRDYRTFTVDTVFDLSPASEAGLRKGDVLAALNGRPASEYTLSEIREVFKREGPCDVTITRGAGRLELKLTLRRLI